MLTPTFNSNLVKMIKYTFSPLWRIAEVAVGTSLHADHHYFSPQLSFKFNFIKEVMKLIPFFLSFLFFPLPSPHTRKKDRCRGRQHPLTMTFTQQKVVGKKNHPEPHDYNLFIHIIKQQLSKLQFLFFFSPKNLNILQATYRLILISKYSN